MTQTRAITLNALSLYAVALVLAAAFAAQFILHELRCRSACCSASCLRRWPSDRSSISALAPPQPLCDVAADGGRRRGCVDPAGAAAHHARRRRLWFGAARLSLLYLGAARLHCRHRPACRDPAVRPSVRGGQGRPAGDRRRVRTNRGVARDCANGGQRGDDAAGMRLRRLRRQPRRSNYELPPSRTPQGRFGISSPRCTAGRASPRSSHAGTCFSVSNATRSRAP